MAIHQDVISEGSHGMAKEIDEAALPLILDNLQKDQYQYPLKSTIRELVSNGVDSHREKFAAIEILEGRAKEEDYYLRREDPMLKDSNFFAGYYNPAFLERSNKPVEIIHRYGDMNETRDKLIIRDYGVGLGHVINPASGVSRMEGYFKVGYSTKRNTAIALGKYGIGAKSALSTDEDFFTSISRFNGEEFRFNIYSYKVQPTTPRLNMETGQMNKQHVLNAGKPSQMVCYSQPTTEKNGMEIQLSTKKLHRQQIIDAIKNQLLYFNDVVFYIEEDGERREIQFKSDVLYEDEHLIISNNDQFSKPHLIINRVNYGYVDFAELELEDMRGNVGFKVQAEDVDINPSRESLKWLGKTKDSVLRSIEAARETASRIVSEKLQADNFFQWIKVSSSLLLRADSDPLISRLGNIIDRDQLKPVYPLNKEIKFTGDILDGLGVTVITPKIQYDKATGTNKTKPERNRGSLHDFVKYPVYIQTEGTLPTKDMWLLEKHKDEGGYVKVKFLNGDENDAVKERFLKAIQKGREKYEKWERIRKFIYDELLKEPSILNYEAEVVPEKVVETFKRQAEQEEFNGLTPEEKRKLNSQIVVQLLNNGWHNKYEVTIQEIIDKESTVIYGFQEDKELLHLISNMCDAGRNLEDDLVVLLISKQNARYFYNHTHVQDFISNYDHSTKTIGMHHKLVQVQTARKIHLALDRLKFMSNFGPFNSAQKAVYDELKAYWSKHHSSQSLEAREIAEYSDKVIELQLFIEAHKDSPEAIALKSKEIFDTQFEGAVGIDLPIYRKLEALLEYVEPIYTIMNAIDDDKMSNLSSELETEIREILRNKNVAMC